MRRTVLAAVVSLLALAGGARASDPVGIYALIDKVVQEPKDGKPERTQVWGVFRFAVKNAGDEYSPPVYGYLYYGLAPGKADETRREWADMKKVAGTGQVIAFASRYGEKGTPHKSSEKSEKPDAFPIADGLHKIDSSSGIAKELRSISLPGEPANDGEVAAGAVTLHARPIADKDRKSVKYVFFITDANGHKEGSKPLPLEAMGKEVSWAPKMKVKAGEKYTWRVFAVAPDWKGPELTSTFKGK